MVTFANIGSVPLPSLKFVGLRVRKIRRIQCVSSLSTIVSQLFEQQLQIIVIFTYPGLYFCLPWGRPCGNHAKRCMNEKTIQCLLNPSQHVPIYLEQFPSYSNRKYKNSPFSRTAAHVFVSPGDAPATITQYIPWMERQFNACQTPRSVYLSVFNSFRGIPYRHTVSMRKSKNRYFHHILVSPGDAPEAITLNLVQMEREFDAYKLSRCMCPSNYNRF